MQHNVHMSLLYLVRYRNEYSVHLPHSGYYVERERDHHQIEAGRRRNKFSTFTYASQSMCVKQLTSINKHLPSDFLFTKQMN